MERRLSGLTQLPVMFSNERAVWILDELLVSEPVHHVFSAFLRSSVPLLHLGAAISTFLVGSGDGSPAPLQTVMLWLHVGLKRPHGGQQGV